MGHRFANRGCPILQKNGETPPSILFFGCDNVFSISFCARAWSLVWLSCARNVRALRLVPERQVAFSDLQFKSILLVTTRFGSTREVRVCFLIFTSLIVFLWLVVSLRNWHRNLARIRVGCLREMKFVLSANHVLSFLKRVFTCL